MREIFRKLATLVSNHIGSPAAFVLALTAVLIWVFTGPFFHYSDEWQLVINTSTTIITFLTIFLLQYTQNRDARAFHLKLDELIKSVKGARNGLVDVEDLSDQDLDALQLEFQELHEKYERELKKRKRL